MPDLLQNLLGRSRASVVDVLRAQVDRRPEAPFLVWSGQATWTYAAALDEAMALATVLDRDYGVGPGVRVASFIDNRPEAYWAWFATHLLGGEYAPLNRHHRGELLKDMIVRT